MNALALISVGGLLPLLIELVIVGLIIWLLLYFIGYIGIPEPFNKVARVIVMLVGLVWLINLLLSLNGQGFIAR